MSELVRASTAAESERAGVKKVELRLTLRSEARSGYRGTEISERHGILAARDNILGTHRLARRAISVAASDSSLGAGEAGTAGDGPPIGNCHHATRDTVRFGVRVRARSGFGLGLR